jgi:hypothetical protein
LNGRGLTKAFNKLTVWLDKRAKSVEKPAMTIQLLLVLLLEAEDDLHGTGSLRYFTCVGNDDTGSISK